MINLDLVGLLVCPQCKQPIELIVNSAAILCQNCLLKYPIKDDIPVMLLEEAISLQQSSHQS